jgi:GTPase SAR1 family protein
MCLSPVKKSRNVKCVLITGMSGAGKSSLLHELAARGYRSVDTDYGDYFEIIDGERLWREDRISALLASAPDELPGVLFVQGTTRNHLPLDGGKSTRAADAVSRRCTRFGA